MPHIEQLHVEDFHRCQSIWDMENQPLMAERFYEEIVNKNRLTFVYIVNEQFIGEGSLVFKTKDPQYTVPHERIYVSRMIVKEEYQNQGIGGALLDYMIDYAEKLGYRELSVGVDSTNRNALHLYKKKGFTTVMFKGEDEHGEYVKLLRSI